MTILLVVESAGKISKISKILGKGYKVMSCGGHIENLDRRTMSIDFDNGFEPQYVITNEKAVRNLKAAMKGCDMLYIASDDDLEGHKIADSLYNLFRPKQYKRLVFHAIDKPSIMKAIKEGGTIDKNKVNAQKARRVLDRLFGYPVSSVLKGHLGPETSAGRVNSPKII